MIYTAKTIEYFSIQFIKARISYICVTLLLKKPVLKLFHTHCLDNATRIFIKKSCLSPLVAASALIAINIYFVMRENSFLNDKNLILLEWIWGLDILCNGQEKRDWLYHTLCIFFAFDKAANCTTNSGKMCVLILLYL